jgi:hypothetical protein
MNRSFYVLAVCGVLLFSNLGTADAVSNLTVVIQGDQQVNNNCPAAPAPCEIVISANTPPGPGARTYPGITISGLDGVNPAKVRAIDDATNDILELVNAKITAAQGTLSGDISFWATFNAGPATNPSANPAIKVNFERTAAGSMKRGSNAAKDNWFKVTGWINDNNTGDNEIGTFSQKTVCCSIPSSYGNFSCPTICMSEVWTNGLLAQRTIKEQFWFYQKYVNDLLNVTNVRINATNVAEEDFSHIGAFDGYTEEFLLGDEEWSRGKGKGKVKSGK